ncbi:MAG: phage baseplate assembly protein V [Alphaproteobacteria bacterium]|nr:phage baseplate assembly protein V [Alphaproteobacteria bacterium]
MVDGFAFSEVVRKLANLIRIGKIAAVNGAQVKVQIGRVTTGWLPIVSTAGETTSWTPISKGEQVVVFSPFGEFAQAFVLRSIYYNNYKSPEDKNSVSLKTKANIKVDSDQKFSANTKNGFEFSSGNTNFKISDGTIELSSGDAHINMSSNSISLSTGDANVQISSSGIQLNCGSSTIDVGSGNISLSSGSITTNPPLCKCLGGL